jgi:hypothetical protein
VDRKKKRKPTSDNPEVQEAMDRRDSLLDDVASAVAEVDRLQDELLKEYMQANGIEEE